MDEDSADVLSLVAEEQSMADDPPAVAGWLHRMCRVAVVDLPATGVGVSLLAQDGSLMRAAASSAQSAVVEELQFSLGEGPCLLAYATRRPVLVPDLVADAGDRWPAYTPAASAQGIRAVFAFPLQVGDARLGALDVYRRETGELSALAQDRAMVFAAAAMAQILGAGTSTDTVDALLGGPTANRFEVHQAQGMVMVQLGVRADEALARLRAHAYVQGSPLVEVAHDVIHRRLVLESDGDGPGDGEDR